MMNCTIWVDRVLGSVQIVQSHCIQSGEPSSSKVFYDISSIWLKELASTGLVLNCQHGLDTSTEDTFLHVGSRFLYLCAIMGWRAARKASGHFLISTHSLLKASRRRWTPAVASPSVSAVPTHYYWRGSASRVALEITSHFTSDSGLADMHAIRHHRHVAMNQVKKALRIS